MATLTSTYQYIARSNKLAPQSGRYGYYLLLYAKTSPNTTTGFHTVTIKTILACSANSSFYQWSCQYAGKINGSTAFSGTNKPWAAWSTETLTAGGENYPRWTLIAEDSVDVDCTNGQAKDITVSGTWVMTAAGTDYTPNPNDTAAVSDTVTLAAIPRKSGVSATDANIGAVSTIVISPAPSANYTHDLYYKAAGQSSYTSIARGVTATVYAWTVPTSLYSLIPNSKSLQITIMCETINGATSLGSNICSITATASEAECAPAVSIIAEDENQSTLALTGNKKKIVKGFSNIKATTTATAKNSATISSIAVKCENKTGTGANCTINNAESAEVTSKATDSRGYSTEAQAAGLTLIDYIPLTVNPTVTRENPGSDTVTVSIQGNYFNGSFGSVNNSLAVTVNVKPIGGSYGSEVTIPVTESGNTYTGSVTLTNVSYTTQHEIRVTASDKVYGEVTGSKVAVVQLSKGTPLFDWGEDDFAFHIPVTLDADPISDNQAVRKQYVDRIMTISGPFLPGPNDAPLGLNAVNFTGTVAVGSINIPQYSKGLLMQSSDAVLVVVDPSRYIYAGFRNGSTWNIKKYT